MKARFLCALMVVWVLASPSARADFFRYTAERSLIRLQVMAASDSDADQAVKLRVRDAVRAVAVAAATGADSPKAAYDRLRASLPALTRAARAVDSSASVELMTTRFPPRLYGETLVPAGRYRAVRITLGEGVGRNWWCVVYPDLCAIDSQSAAALGSGAPVRFYSGLMKWLRGGEGA